MTQPKQSFRPQVESLDDRTVPAVVVQQPNGIINIYGTRWNDWLRVYDNPYGATVVDTRAATYVFPTWSVTGIRFWGYAGNDIFYNEKGGLTRALRELSATSASRTNGCIFCASVHARFASHHSKRPDDVQRLLDDGTAAPQDDPQWRAVIDASVALTAIPNAFGPEHVARLRDAGLDDLAIIDAINGAAFFNWANRLMLSLGEPTPPEG